MYQGTKTSGSYSPKTGLHTFQFVGVNLSKNQIEELTGRELPVEPNYNTVQDLNGKTVRPCHFYFKSDTIGLVKIIYQVGSDSAVAKSGNYQVCTSTGAVVWAKKDGEVKAEFVDHQPLKIGEAEVIAIISKLINFDPNSGENLYAQMTNLKQDAKSLFEGTYTGFEKLAKWLKDNNKYITLVTTVKQVSQNQEDGSVILNNKQRIATDPRTFFHGEFAEWMIDSLKKRYESSLVVGLGQTKAYPIIKDLFTYEFQDFVAESCVNYVPETPQQGW